MEEGSTISKMRRCATVTLLLPERAKAGDSTATGDAAARSDSKDVCHLVRHAKRATILNTTARGQKHEAAVFFLTPVQ